MTVLRGERRHHGDEDDDSKQAITEISKYELYKQCGKSTRVTRD